MPDRLDEKAVVAFPHGDRNHIEFTLCLSDLARYDAQNGRRLSGNVWRLTSENSGNVAVGRNIIVRAFLEETDADWLWFIDTDEPFPKDILERLIMSAHPVDRPVLSGLVFAQAANRQLAVSPVPIVYDPDLNDFREVTILPDVRHWEVASAGCGCLLIHRTVLEAVGEAHKDDAFPWFKWAQHDRNGTPDLMSEDFTFSLRAKALGFPVVVDTTIEAGHVKRRTLTSRDYWAQIPPEHRPRRIVAVVPVKDKLPLTSAIVGQLRDQADHVIVVDNGSSKQTRNWLSSQPDITVLNGAGMGIHEMWNLGALHGMALSPAGCDVAFINNDVSLGDDCLPMLALSLVADQSLAVVCPNYDGRTVVYSGPTVNGVEYRNDPCADRYDGTGGIAGFCFMVRGEFLHRYQFPTDCKWWFGDNDLLLTVQVAGRRCGIVLDATCEHLDGGGQTGVWDSPEMQDQLLADQAAFCKKWDAKVAPVAGGGEAATPSGGLTLPPPATPPGAKQ